MVTSRGGAGGGEGTPTAGAVRVPSLAALRGERLCLQRVVLGLRDRPAVEQLLRLLDLPRGAAGGGDALDVVVELRLRRLRLLQVPVGHALMLGDQVHEDA